MTYVVVMSYYMLSWDNAAVILSDCSCAVIEFVLFFWKVRARLISGVGAGIYSIIYHVAPTIVVKIGENCSCRPDPRRKGNPRGAHFDQEIAFFKGLDKLQDRCPDIVICFLMLPDYLFRPYWGFLRSLISLPGAGANNKSLGRASSQGQGVRGSCSRRSVDITTHLRS